MSIATARASINDAFAGIDGSAVVVIALVALINTIRRSSLSGGASPCLPYVRLL